MALDSRIRELDSRHKNLDLAIRSQTRHPSVDDLEINILKKQKLKIKEELAVLRSRR